MNADTAGDKDIELSEKPHSDYDHGHTHEEPHHHIEEEECALEDEAETRTIYLN